jgi:hypothetical protein
MPLRPSTTCSRRRQRQLSRKGTSSTNSISWSFKGVLSYANQIVSSSDVFYRIGVPEINPRSQLASTTSCRMFVQASAKETLFMLLKAVRSAAPPKFVQSRANSYTTGNRQWHAALCRVIPLSLTSDLRGCALGCLHTDECSCCASNDMRTAIPQPFLAYYPGQVSQNLLTERVHFVGPDPKTLEAGRPPAYEKLLLRRNFAPTRPKDLS